jgi:hypothetical protein
MARIVAKLWEEDGMIAAVTFFGFDVMPPVFNLIVKVDGGWVSAIRHDATEQQIADAATAILNRIYPVPEPQACDCSGTGVKFIPPCQTRECPCLDDAA